MRTASPLLRLGGIAVAACALALTGCDRGQHPAQIGTKAPEFSVADGTTSVDLARYRGRVVILNFWATWCAPCVEEIPSLMQLHQAMPQIAILAVSTDEDAAVYRQFLTEHHVTLTTVRDGAQRANALYGTFRYPESYVIDRNGIIRRKFIGPQDWTNPELLDYLSKL